MAYDPSAPAEVSLQNSEPVRHAQELGIPRGEHTYEGVPAYIATPELLRLMGADPATIPPSTDVVTGRTQNLVSFDQARGDQGWPTTRAHLPDHTSLPDTLLTSGAPARRHLTPVRAGWLAGCWSPRSPSPARSSPPPATSPPTCAL
ncbi:hypothetical protein [Frankia sp. QA3]|uniref:hypothetical protein n=1 Tax=Frankia sp. QA3 TaxID=710111 RepID=UPI000269C106|nr:hypothetical protein [Frankia sp. QA3]EIV92535.1 hypothetical protein FraQA3DRAFT_2113 [Frankia sp. QA3]